MGMGVGGQSSVESYGLDPRFEAVVATLLASSQLFWRRIGHRIDPEALAQAPAVLLARGAKAIGLESGDGPASSVIVMQRLRRWLDEGKVTQEAIEAAGQMLDDVEDAGIPSVEAVIAELAPVVRKRLRRQAVKDAATAYAGGEEADWGKVVALAEEASKLGEAEQTRGLTLDDTTAFDALEARKLLTYLPIGIPELDAFLDGGLQRRRLGISMGDPGAGKSMLLTHACATTVLGGLNAVKASLELPEDEEMSRLVANLTGLTTREVLNGHMGEARRRISEMRANLGRFFVRYFTPQTTTVADIKAWVTEIEQREGIEIHLVTIDPLDEIVFTGAGARDSTYTTQGKATKDLRNWIKESNKWSWATSHVKAGDSRRKIVGLNDVADSRWKVKTPDVVLGLSLGEQGKEILINVAKNRGGEGHSVVGPLPTGFANGMLVNVARGQAGGVPTNDVPF